MKKIISIILLISMLCGLGVNVSAYSGTGTESNPYVITSPEDLMNMKNDLSAHYVLGNSINMSGVWYEPIGNDIDGAFTGSFDGKGYTISNLDLDLEGSKYVGLFGYLDGIVKNVNLTNVVASGYKYVGGIAGYADENSEINNCSVSGTIMGTYINGDIFTSGVIGYSNCEIIRNCTSSCNINVYIQKGASSYSGGIVGFSTKSYIDNCVNEGRIYALVVDSWDEAYAGGIVGAIEEGKIDSCINKGEIISEGHRYRWAGGICASSGSNVIICNNINKGDISSTEYSGGIVARNSGEIQNCKNEGNIICSAGSSSSSQAGGIAGLNYNKICNSTNTGDVIAETSYHTSSDSYSPSAGGISGSNAVDGTISSCTNDGKIYSYSEPYPSNVNYVPNPYSGGVTGKNNGTIEYCLNSGIVEAFADSHCYIGGMAGYYAGGSIRKCSNNGLIFSSADASLGGIVGYYQSAYSITDCFNSGIIRCTSDYSYNHLGGIAGENSKYSYTRRCINSAYVSGSEGGIIGSCSYINDSDCYVLDSAVVGSYGASYYSKLNSAEMRAQQYYNNYDFAETWYIDSNTNSGFPQLQNLPEHMVLNECVLFIEKSDVESLNAYIGNSIENVAWSSEDDSIATVSSNGYVTGVGLGSCTITATNSEGMKANCCVTVYDSTERLSIESNEYTISIGDTLTPVVTQSPNETTENLRWESDNTDIATVDKYTGLVTAKKSGIANITATTILSNISATCKVKVTGSPVTKLSLSKTSASINKDDNLQLTISVTPSAYDGQISWSSSDESIAVVDENGLITAKYPGMAYIYAQAESGVTTQCTVTVKAPATEIKLNKSELTLQKGYTEKLLPAMMPEYTTDSISWASSNSSYVSVSTDGTVTAKAVGQVIITATTTSGEKAYCTVNVVNPSVPVSSVTLDKTELIMTKADMAQLKASILPTNATNQNLTWVSSDESVATVNSTGVVTAVDTGVAIISATANNGVYHECVIKVISASGSSVVLSDAKASPDDIVQVKASLVKNPGISGYKFTVNYDETLLTPVAVTPNSEFGGSITTNLDDDNRVGLNIVWYANEDVDVNGELFTIDFKVSDSAEYGDTSSVSIEYGAKDICNTAGEYFALYIDDATISIEEAIPGDIYEDGEVVVYDLTLLSRYITSLETFTERQKEAADVNNDNLVNVLDVIKMAQYLTGWSGVQLMSLDLFSLDEPVAPVISVGSASVNSVNEAEIPVYIKSNTGIAAYRFILDYNAEDIEILSITPSELIIKENFNHNLGAEIQAEDGLIVTSHTSGGNMTEDGVLFTIKVRYKNPTDTSVSPISIRDIFDNMGNEDGNYVTATYETGYALGSDYIVANKVVGDTNFSCELYFDDSYAEQSAKAIIAFYDGDGRMVQLMPKDITVKPGKVDVSIDYDKKAYATYKLMIWEGMNSLKPITKVK